MEENNLNTIAEQGKEFDDSENKIFNLIEEHKYFECRDELLKRDEVEMSEILEDVIRDFGMQMAVILFRTLPKDSAVEVFSRFSVDNQLGIIDVITDIEIKNIIEELDFDDKIDILEEMPSNLVDKILEKTPSSERKLINTFLMYKEDSAGSLMTPDYINLGKNMTVRQALDHIKEIGLESETIYTCYVLEKGRKLEGIVSLRTLVISDYDMKVSDLMREDIIYVHVNDDQEEVADIFKRYGFLAVPVVDNERRLVGIITIDDILDVMEEETTEDIERMGGVIDTHNREYLDISIMGHVKARLPWLLLLMCSYFITGGIISSFEQTLSKVIALVIYMPMLMGTGGNSGSQSSTLIIRGMATGDIDTSDWIKVIWKELRIGLIIGICVSIINVIRIIFIDHNSIGVALTVSCAMTLVVIIAKLIGASLPMLAKKIGIDPALMAGPMMSSITDVISLLTYFLMAMIFLGI